MSSLFKMLLYNCCLKHYRVTVLMTNTGRLEMWGQGVRGRSKRWWVEQHWRLDLKCRKNYKQIASVFDRYLWFKREKPVRFFSQSHSNWFYSNIICFLRISKSKLCPFQYQTSLWNQYKVCVVTKTSLMMQCEWGILIYIFHILFW